MVMKTMFHQVAVVVMTYSFSKLKREVRLYRNMKLYYLLRRNL